MYFRAKIHKITHTTKLFIKKYTYTMLLNEDYNIKTGIINGKKMIFIDPETSENTFPIKDEIKNFGAKWLKDLKTWGWYAGRTPESMRRQYDTMIKPCLEYLMSVENQNTSNDDGEPVAPRDVVAACDQLLAQIEGEDWSEIELMNVNAMSKDEMKNKLEGFKMELVRAMGTPEFKALLEPIIRFRRAAGYQFSFLNSIRIILQDPKATMVKSKTNWAAVNRTIAPNAIPIVLYRPGGKAKYGSKDDKERVKQDMLSRMGKNWEDLTPGEREIINTEMRKRTLGGGFKTYFAYDVRFTKQIEGTEDLVGDISKGNDIKWHEYDSNETERDSIYIDAAIETAKKYGLKIEYKSDEELNGAKGYATHQGGIIALGENAPRNRGFLNTIIHETAHHMLHIDYLKQKDTEFGQYFLGRAQGRGLIEQQAELTAWIVMRILGYEDMGASLNYMGMWGMDAKSACKVFDMVANAASKLSSSIEKFANGVSDDEVNESVRLIRESIVTGLDVAKLFGREGVELYYQGKEEAAAEGDIYDTDVRMENIRRNKNTFFEMLYRMDVI